MAGTYARIVKRLAALAACALFALPGAAAAESDPVALQNAATVTEQLDKFVDLSLPFADQSGKTRPLREFLLPKRPAIITPVYYGCDRVCTYTLNATLKLLNSLDLRLGSDFTVVTFTINPEENFELAARKAFNYYEQLKDPEAGRQGWHFLTNSGESSAKLAAQLGFGFKRDGRDFSHPAVVMVLTPEGKVARYFYGVDYPEKDVRFALVEASKGRIGSTVDKILLYCFRFDHLSGKYSLAIRNLTQAVSLAVVLGLGAVLVTLRVKEKRRVFG
jgi:protein SCO1/2